MVKRHALHMLSVLLSFVWNLNFDFCTDILERLHLLVVLLVDNCKAFAFVF